MCGVKTEETGGKNRGAVNEAVTELCIGGVFIDNFTDVGLCEGAREGAGRGEICVV